LNDAVQVNALRERSVEWTAPQLALDFAPDATGITRVARRRVRYPYTFLKPFWFDDQPAGIATVLIQSGSGGLYGGERLVQRLDLAPGAAVHFSTQAAAVVHARRGHAPTSQRLELRLGADTYLEYVPDPLILFPDAGLVQHAAVVLDPGAVLLHADGVVRHDPGPGDRPFAFYRNALEIDSCDGTVLVRERMAVTGDAFDRMLGGAHGAWRACGLVLLVAPARVAEHAAWCSLLAERLDLLERETGGLYAASASLPNDAGIACRIVARDGAVLRTVLEACWRDLRCALTGSAAPRKRK
jgi:urease accessory protein